MKITISTLVTFLSLSAFSDQYVVLFKQAEIAVGSLEHGAYTQALQESNQKSITDLEKWITRNQIRTENKIKNLWLVRGATLSVSPQAANKLKKEPWVHGVYLDKTRTMLPLNQIRRQVPHSLNLEMKQLGVLKKWDCSRLERSFPLLMERGFLLGFWIREFKASIPSCREKSPTLEILLIPFQMSMMITDMEHMWRERSPETKWV